MKKRLLLGLLIFSACLLGIVISRRHNPQKLMFQGKTLAAWSWQIYSPYPRVRDEATAAFKAMGKEAVPGLISLLKGRDSAINQFVWSTATKLPRWLGRFFLKPMPPLRAGAVHRVAARCLGIIGPDASPAVTELGILMHNEPPTLWEAAAALAQIGKASVPVLLEASRAADPNLRQAATFALGEIGLESPEAVRALVGALGDPVEPVRASAIHALSNMGKPVVPMLTETMESGNEQARLSAGMALMSAYPLPRVVVPPLTKMLQDPSPRLREWAARSLGKVCAGSQRTIPELVRASEDTDDQVRAAAKDALEKIASAETAPMVQKPN